MKWNRIRYVHIAIVIVPCVWFVCVFFTVFRLEPIPTPPHNPHPHLPLRVKAEEKQQHHPNMPESRIKQGIDFHEDKDVHKRVTTKNLPINVHGPLLRRGIIHAKTKSELTHKTDRMIDSAKDGGVARMDVHERRGGRRGEEGGEGGRGGKGGGGRRGGARGGRNQVMDHRADGAEVTGKGRGDVNSDVMKSMDDVYADVTFPPYVERLPSGAQGQGRKGLKVEVDTLPKERQREYREKWGKNQFNQYVSDLIPVHRELPDNRDSRCQKKQYPPPSSLPEMSVVIVFHNEAWSTLLRSVHSILDRTPTVLLQEIVMVDDFSDMDHLKRPLEKYFLNYPKVKIIRMAKRGGLIQARLRGFEATTAEVVVFLDSHIECSIGWAEPLLWMVSQDYRTVPFPVIDTISKDTLTYIRHPSSPSGTFSMTSLTFTWSNTLDKTPHPLTGAIRSPTMPGGLFAISRKWFQELGAFDPDLEYWGGENMELSFKVWMCGGSIVIADCSHIGHIFRTQNPITWTRPLGHHNYVRVAMVWLDDYKNHYFERINYRLGDYGNVSSRQALRARLKCHTFGWYVDNVYPELKEQLVFNATFAGQVKHEESGLCLDKLTKEKLFDGPQLIACHQQGGNQFWYFRDDRYLQADTYFLCKKSTTPDIVGLCGAARSSAEWTYSLTTRQLRHVSSGKCLQTRPETTTPNDVTLAPCRALSTDQKWTLDRRKPFSYK